MACTHLEVKTGRKEGEDRGDVATVYLKRQGQVTTIVRANWLQPPSFPIIAIMWHVLLSLIPTLHLKLKS